MRYLYPGFMVGLVICTIGISSILAFNKPEIPKQQDPVLNFRLTIMQTSNIVYALRNSTLLDAKTANSLADILVSQASDTTLNKSLQQKSPHQ